MNSPLNPTPAESHAALTTIAAARAQAHADYQKLLAELDRAEAFHRDRLDAPTARAS